MVSDGEFVYVANQQFDPKTGEIEESFRPFEYWYSPRNSNYTNPQGNTKTPYLASGKVGMLEATWTRLPLALRKNIHDLSYRGVHAQLLAFSPESIFGYQLTQDRKTRMFSSVLSVKRNSQLLTTKIPTSKRLLALISTERSLVAAGTKSTSGGEFGKKGAPHNVLSFLSPDDLQSISEVTLPASPVYNGLAAAQGRLYVCTDDGVIHCFQGR